MSGNSRVTGYTLDIWNLDKEKPVWFYKNKPYEFKWETNDEGECKRVSPYPERGGINFSSSGRYKTKEKAFRAAQGICEKYPLAVVEVGQWIIKKVKGVEKRGVRYYYFSALSRNEFVAFFERIEENRKRLRELL